LIDPPQVQPLLIFEHVNFKREPCGLEFAERQQLLGVGMDLPGRDFRAVGTGPLQPRVIVFLPAFFKLMVIADVPL
jgi:hypothetical protein